MSEAIYQQVEDAIRRKLYVCGRYRTSLGGPSFEYPVAIVHGNIMLRDGDCGLAKSPRVITTDEWRALAGDAGEHLYRKVGMWSFARADDPAADAIRHCHESPHSAGWSLHRLREIEAAARAVYHQLAVGEAGEGDPADLAWCVRTLGEVLDAAVAGVARSPLDLRAQGGGVMNTTDRATVSAAAGYQHRDYDGPPDSRCGTAPNVEAARAQIDERIDEGFDSAA